MAFLEMKEAREEFEELVSKPGNCLVKIRASLHRVIFADAEHTRVETAFHDALGASPPNPPPRDLCNIK